MNNIYKVIWSKAKNCYVVASEIARSHTKSASGAEKIGGGTRRKLLASLMALSLLCGGLGVASAEVDVKVAVSSAPDAVEVYTKTGVDTLLGGKADKTALDGKADKGDVDTNKAAIQTLETGKANTSLDNLSDAGKAVIKTMMTDELEKKADKTYVDNALNDKADTGTVNALDGRVGGVEGKVTTLETTVGDASHGLVKDVADLRAQGNDLNTALGNKANQNDLDAANQKITENGNKITDLQKKTEKLSTDGTELKGMTTVSGTNVEAGALKVTGAISDGAGVNTTLADIKASMTQTAKNKTDIDDLKTKTTGQQTAIDGLNEKTTKITYDTALGTNVDGVTFNAGAVTGVTSINGTKIGIPEGGEYISQDGSIWGNLKTVDGQMKKNADNIETNKNAITALDTKVGTVGTGTYLDPHRSVGENLGLLDAGLKQEVADRTAADTALSDRIGTVTDDGEYIKKSDTKNVSENLIVLDTQAKTNAEAIAKETADRKAAIGELAVNGNYIEKDKNVSDNLVELDKQAKANADAITETNQRTAGITRDDTKKETSIEDKVTVDTNGNIKAEGTITSNGLDARAGEIKTTGKVSAGDVSTGTLETMGNAKIGGDLTVNGKLNVGEIYMEHKKQESTGEEYDSATSITADGISNNAKVTDRNGVKTESKFTHDKEGSTTYAYQGDAANWKKSTSNVTADGVENVAEDSKGNNNTFTQTSTDTKNTLTDKEGNTSTTRQDSKGIYGYAKDKDGNKSYTKQEGNRIAESVIGQDGKETKSEMTSTDITNTAKDGTIKNDAKDIVNNASGNISNKSQTMDTTVTGKATESYGSLDTTVNGNETHIVKGTKTESVDGQVTENYKAGQATNVTGDQDITVSGTQTTTATDINRNASSGMIDTIDNDYGTNTETKVAGETKTEVSIKGTDEKGEYIRGATQSRDYLIKGTLKNSETKTAEATSSEVTDGTNKASTIQDAKNLAGSVTNGTETGISGIHANNDGSVSIDSTVVGGGMSSVINQKKDSIQSAVGDGTNSTVIRQDKDNVTIASSKGMVAIGGKDIVNNAQDTITNTAGTSITNQVKDSKVTTDVDGTTFENKTAAVSDGGTTTTKINGNHITTGRVDANELGVSDKDDQGNTADFSVKAGEGIKGSVTDKDGNKTYTTVTATENSFQVQDKDGNIKNHQVNTKDKSENTITNGTKANTVTSTADGTTFNNSKANTVFEGGTYTDTTIKGNTITTGKVTMDYADVMKDLGVRGNANITGKTTTGSLEVTGTSTLKGNVTMESNATVKKNLTVEGTTTTETLNVTKNAEVGGELKVAKKATFEDSVSIAKDLSVGGDVTAKSYKVGDKTYISADGINANDQKITNVADGSISEGSKDAVNGGQLYQVKNDLEGKVNKVGANAAAMANLHPMEFDPDSKWNIAAAMGNYGSETATAIGAFYRPNEDVMVNFSTAFGTGENMVGGGVSVRLGKGGNKLSREESNALKAQVNDLTARMDALLSVLNPNMSKDFPDVPENHWAYEAVSRLAGNDIVQGYPDGEFHGERTMTRYEMAEIIYNALSRGAEAERELVEEFKPELQAMAASEKATAERAEG